VVGLLLEFKITQVLGRYPAKGSDIVWKVPLRWGRYPVIGLFLGSEISQ
jgi:hypothetical protein